MASNSILKLQVDDRQYEASLKSAQQGLQALMNALRNSGKSFSDLDKNTAQYVRALGNMDATAKTTRGRIGEMSSAFVELSQVEKQLTDQERQSPVGKALTESLNQLKQRTIEAKQELADLDKQLTSQKAPATTGGGGLFGGGKLDGMLQVFGGNVMTKGVELATSAVTSLVSETGDMIRKGVELAKQGEGIRIAFERLGRGDILQGLREATHGTVTDLELMKAAVKFNDFKLPVEELGTMLAFAQQKAKDTGQSVDYMVDSIVTGLGRKSLMILDNLGLSATEVKEKMAETGDMTKAVGAIIREQMSKAGDYVETAADRAAQANVSLQNKMEELGRKFAPLEEASNSLWTSMKIGILDVVGGPLARLLNGLTEAGRMMNAYGKMGGSGKVGRMTANLAGASEGNRQSIYQQQQAQFWKYINPREQQLKDIRAWQRGERGEALQGRINAITQKYGSLDATKIQAEVDAAKKMLTDYQQAAKTILKPVKAEINTSDAVKSIDELKVRLIELQAQRKKVKAGTDEAKRLDAEIRNVKADIKLQNPDALKTTHTTTPHEKAAEMVANAERTYAETLQKSAIRMEVGMDSTLEGKKKELSAQERLFDAYNDAYATYKDPKYKDAASEAANKIKSLAGEVKSMEDAVAKSKVKWEQGDSGFNTKTMQAWMQGRQGDLSKADYGSKEYKDISGNIADMNAIKTVLDTTIKNAIDTTQVDMTPLWSKMFGETLPDGATASLSEALTKMYEEAFDGVDIDDDSLQAVIDKINEKLKEMGIEPIKIDFTTGGVDKEGKKTEKAWNLAAQAVQNVGSAMNQIEDPAAKVAGTVMQAIASIALGFAMASSNANTAGTGWGWLAWLAAGTAAMATTISTIHSLTGFAEGGIVKGNSYSGDNIMANGGDIGLNAGELVLNRAQTNSLYAQMSDQDGGGGLNVTGVLRGENIFLSANRYAKRSGKGELVTWKR